MLYANPELSEPREVETITIPKYMFEDLLRAEYFIKCMGNFIGDLSKADFKKYEEKIEMYKANHKDFVKQFVDFYKIQNTQ